MACLVELAAELVGADPGPSHGPSHELVSRDENLRSQRLLASGWGGSCSTPGVSRSPFGDSWTIARGEWSLTSLREKVVKIGAKVIAHSRYAIFQMAEVAVPRELLGRIPDRIARLRPRDLAPC